MPCKRCNDTGFWDANDGQVQIKCDHSPIREPEYNDKGWLLVDMAGSELSLEAQLRKENAELKDALQMIISEYKTPDDMLLRGYACGLTGMQQHGIVKARKLLKREETK